MVFSVLSDFLAPKGIHGCRNHSSLGINKVLKEKVPKFAVFNHRDRPAFG